MISSMTSRERVRAAFMHQKPDRIPAAFGAVETVRQKLMKHYGFTSQDQLMQHLGIDISPVSPRYIGPELKHTRNAAGQEVCSSFWGYEYTIHVTDVDSYRVTSFHPLSGVESVEDVKNQYRYPDPDWFDYDSLAEQCQRYPDKALIMGHEGPFQVVTNLISMEEFFILMMEEPETAHYILDQMVAFELEYYRRCFEAAHGRIDILRPHDDYGTQLSMLFSVDMWREFFEENTRKLVDLAHSYGAFYQQHSCGAVRAIIPDLIRCGVDALEPLQKVNGLDPESLQAEFGGKITFHGGIDTQGLLPFGTPEEVTQEVHHYIDTLGQCGGYILMASQSFEGDVPIANIEAVYQAERQPRPLGSL